MGGEGGVKRKGEGYFLFRFHFVCPYIQARRGVTGSRGVTGGHKPGNITCYAYYFSLIHVG